MTAPRHNKPLLIGSIIAFAVLATIIGLGIASVFRTLSEPPAAPPIERENVAPDATGRIAVINAWGREGAAAQVKDQLANAGFSGIVTANATVEDMAESSVLYRSEEHRSEAEAIAETLGVQKVGQMVEGSTWQREHEIVVVIGQDRFGTGE